MNNKISGLTFYKENFKPVYIDELCTSDIIYSFYDIINSEVTKLYLFSGTVYVFLITKTKKILYKFFNSRNFERFIKLYPSIEDTENTNWYTIHSHVINLINNSYAENFILTEVISFTDIIYTISDISNTYRVCIHPQTNQLITDKKTLSETDILLINIKIEEFLKFI